MVTKFIRELGSLDQSLELQYLQDHSIVKKSKVLAKKFKLNILFDQDEEQVAKLYLNHTFLLYPNTYEDFGMPPVEALACGCIPVQRQISVQLMYFNK